MNKSRVIPLFSHPKLSLGVVSALVILNFASQRLFDWHPLYVSSELAFSMLTIFMAGTASILYQTFISLSHIIEKIVRSPHGDTSTWFNAQILDIFSGERAYAIMIILIIGGLVTTNEVYVPWTGFVRFVYFLLTGIQFGIMGVIGWSFWGLIIFLHRLSTFNVKYEPFLWLDEEIKQLHNVYLRTFGIGTIIYLNAVVGIWLSPGGLRFIQNSSLIRLWVFPLAAIVIVYFLAIQYYIHRIMTNYKQMAITNINKLIKEAFDVWQADESVEKIKLVSELLSWKDILNREREWPLNLVPVLTIISGLLLPTIKTIMELFTP